MQYILIFITVFLIMQTVILLFFFMIIGTAEDVAVQVRKTFLKEMEVFDELYEEKSEKLKAVQEEYERFNSNILKKTELKTENKTTKEVSSPVHMSDVPAAKLVGRDFASNYRSIRHSFRLDPANVINAVAENSVTDEETVIYSQKLQKLNEKLTFDAVFNLSVLNSCDQEDVLRKVLTEEEQSLLDEFIKRTGKMDAVAFHEWIQSELFLNSPEPVIYAGNVDEIPQGEYEVHEEKTICEGVRVLKSGKMYDYSL